MAGTTTDLERQLADLLDQERFEPPEEFKANAEKRQKQKKVRKT